MINLDSLLALLAVPEENVSLFSLRHSKKVKRLIFKPSIRNGFEIVLPRFYDDNWVLETVTTSKPKIEKRLAEIKEARTELKPTSIILPLIGSSWKVIYRETNDKDLDAITETPTTLEVSEKAEDVFWTSTVLQEWLKGKAREYLP